MAILARDARLIAAVAQVLARRGGSPPLVLRTAADLLDAALGEPQEFGHLLIEADPPHDPSLVDALTEAALDLRVGVLPSAEGPPARLEACISALLAEARRHAAPAADALAPGLSGGGLLLRYQPVVRVADRGFVMVEALARWQGDPFALGADSFVPEIERAGLARALAVAVTRLAARDLARHAPGPRLVVSVNLPVEEFERRNTPAWIARALREARLARPRLAIELTETSPVRDFARLHQSLRRFRAAGHAVFIDDFALDDRRRRLLRLPFSGVKLDRDLVERLATSARARQQVRRLARAGLVLTAEGVASAALWRALRALGVARAQGFWVARPLPAALLGAWSQRWRSTQPR